MTSRSRCAPAHESRCHHQGRRYSTTLTITSNSSSIPWAQATPDGCLTVAIDLGIYPLDAVSRCVYEFTDRAFVFLTRSDDQSCVVVRFQPRSNDDLTTIIGEFSNRLLEHKLRLEIAQETRAIRELLVAQAFVEADFLDR